MFIITIVGTDGHHPTVTTSHQADLTVITTMSLAVKMQIVEQRHSTSVVS